MDSTATSATASHGFMAGGREATVPLSRGQCFYREFGGAQMEKTVLCLHGFGLCSTMWVRVMEGLARQGVRSIAIDFFGSGYSDALSAETSMDLELMVEQSGELMEYLGFGDDTPYDVMGFSMGGAVAAGHAAAYAGRVDKLLLLAPAGLTLARNVHQQLTLALGRPVANLLTRPGVGDRIINGCGSLLELVNDYVELAEPASERLYEALNKESRRTWSVGGMVQRVWPAHPLLQGYFVSRAQLHYAHNNPEYIRAQLKIVRDFEPLLDFIPDTYARAGAACGSRVLVLWGELDQLLPHSDELLATIGQLMPESATVTVRDAGHGMLCEKPEFVEAQIFAFLRSSRDADEALASAGLPMPLTPSRRSAAAAGAAASGARATDVNAPAIAEVLRSCVACAKLRAQDMGEYLYLVDGVFDESSGASSGAATPALGGAAQQEQEQPWCALTHAVENAVDLLTCDECLDQRRRERDADTSEDLPTAAAAAAAAVVEGGFLGERVAAARAVQAQMAAAATAKLRQGVSASASVASGAASRLAGGLRAAVSFSVSKAALPLTSAPVTACVSRVSSGVGSLLGGAVIHATSVRIA